MGEFPDPCPAGGVHYDGPFPGSTVVPCPDKGCGRHVAVSGGRVTDHTRLAKIIAMPGLPLQVIDGRVFGYLARA